jgi:hypothetical protein
MTDAEDSGDMPETISERGVVDTAFALHDMQADETETVHALVNKRCRHLRVTPVHGFTDNGEFSGFRLLTSPEDCSAALPINRQMFYGVAAAEVRQKSGGKSHGGLHPVAVSLFTDFERSRSTMEDFLRKIRAQAKEAEATLGCAPVFEEGANVHGVAMHHMRARDSAHWTPDEPETIGLYHGFVKRPGQHAREHRVFILCSGGLRRACDEFLNLSLDLAQTSISAGELCDSEEAWWLRTACSRSRAALIAQCAEQFGFDVPTHDDLRCFNQKRKIAQLSVETLHHDLQRTRSQQVACFSACTDPTLPRNGVLMTVAPTEGFLLFRGAPRVSGNATDYGAPFGSQETCGIFPVSTAARIPTIADRQSTTRWAQADTCTGGTFVALDEEARARTRHHLRIDEKFMKALESLQWSRDFGVVELMPIVVGIF